MIQAKRCGIFGQSFILESILIFKKQIMHSPEISLVSCCLRGLCGMLGVRMDVRQRKIAKSKTQIITELLLNRFNDWMGLPAGRTFVVTIFQQRDRSID